MPESPESYREALGWFAEARDRLKGWSWEISAAQDPARAAYGAVWRILTWHRAALARVPRALPSILAGWPTAEGDRRARECARLMGASWFRREWDDSLDPSPDLIAAWRLPMPRGSSEVTAWALGPGPDFALIAGFDSSGQLYYWEGGPGTDPAGLLTIEPPGSIRVAALVDVQGRRFALAATEEGSALRVWDLGDRRAAPAHRDLFWHRDSHLGLVTAATIDPRADRVAAATANNHLLVWDLKAGRPLPDWSGHSRLEGPIVALDLEPGGRTLLASDGRQVIIFQRDETGNHWSPSTEAPWTWSDPHPGAPPIRAVAVDWKTRRVVACDDRAAWPWRLAESANILLEPRSPSAMPGPVVAASWAADSDRLALAVGGDPRRPLAWVDLDDAPPGLAPPPRPSRPGPIGVGVHQHPAGPIGLALEPGGWLSAWDPGWHREHRARAAYRGAEAADLPPVLLMAGGDADRPLWVVAEPDAAGTPPLTFELERPRPDEPGARAIARPRGLPEAIKAPRWAAFGPGRGRLLLVSDPGTIWLGRPDPDGHFSDWAELARIAPGPGLTPPAWSPLGDLVAVLDGSGTPWIWRFGAGEGPPSRVVVPEMPAPGAQQRAVVAIGSDGRVTAAGDRRIFSWATAEGPGGPGPAVESLKIRSGHPVHLDPDRSEVWLWQPSRSVLSCWDYRTPGNRPVAEDLRVAGAVGPGGLALARLGDGRGRRVVAGDDAGWIWAWDCPHGPGPGQPTELIAALPLGMPAEQVVVPADAPDRVAVRDRSGRLIQFTLMGPR